MTAAPLSTTVFFLSALMAAAAVVFVALVTAFVPPAITASAPAPAPSRLSTLIAAAI